MAIFWKPSVQLELYHHGIKGQKWGVRRYRDENGRLTPLGNRKRLNMEVKGDKAFSEGRIQKAAKDISIYCWYEALLPPASARRSEMPAARNPA